MYYDLMFLKEGVGESIDRYWSNISKNEFISPLVKKRIKNTINIYFAPINNPILQRYKSLNIRYTDEIIEYDDRYSKIIQPEQIKENFIISKNLLRLIVMLTNSYNEKALYRFYKGDYSYKVTSGCIINKCNMKNNKDRDIKIFDSLEDLIKYVVSEHPDEVIIK